MVLPVYATREQVKDALDVAGSYRVNRRIDDAIAASSRDADRLCRRIFYPWTGSRTFDWPMRWSPTPWRLWLDQGLGDPPMPDLATLTSVTSGATPIATADVLLRPDNGPPYTYLELDTDSTAAFGQGAGSQRDITVAGVWTYTLDSAASGTLTAAIASTTATTCTVTDSAAIGVGDLIRVDTERLQVTGKAMASTGQTVAGAGLTARNDSVALTVSGGTFVPGETLLIDAERVLVDDVAGTLLVVRRAQDGTVLAAHSAGATIYAPRTLTVVRASAGTTAATHDNGATITRHVPPALVNELVVAQSLDTVAQQSSGYARTVGTGENARQASGRALRDLRDRVRAAHGRRLRKAAI